jgi:hypothetical protein
LPYAPSVVTKAVIAIRRERGQPSAILP